ncbi:phosphoribosylaminoimidazolesuccinocarboxamide synthase [Alkalibacillus haloalkaliphilus]|uniref:Phosphoribosylaminoimidazole-succinocarboxamide synthase n=1 Tax=Alkalibacillus haloalkaliphilus TaxID=94136 RepID=A0A511WCF1_9BACI|nr:phosphoribosylaminoimidazolesuccinocarboxamide synthase [Alkalibacillus haloalkaliphilus]GEN46942.1 phosphoribosylaminoimidazole-succinocarboxamide synthase [Alkalibacillus haloalkaliphilus]
MEKRALLYEGKAKQLFETNDPNILWVQYKDALTAFNGEKKERAKGKGRLNNEISSILFHQLSTAGIANHFVKRLSETEQLVKKTSIIPIEVVVRNVAAGSLSRRLGLEEGVPLNTTIVEYYYKDDDLGDPLINEDHIQLLDLVSMNQLNEMKEMALKVNGYLTDHFKVCDVKLVDFKLEFGFDEEGKLILSDEISPDTCRLWDVHTNEKLDKDVFREGIGQIDQAYETILKRLKGAIVTD